MADLPNGFTVWDYVIFAASLLISMGIGVFFALKGGGQKTQGEYLMGGRSMQLLPVTISILVSFLSAITMLGTPAEMYQQGTEYALAGLGYMLGFLIAGVFFVPLLYPLGLTSAYEYFELRFHSRAVRLLGTYIMILGQTIYVALASYAPATALEAVTGFPVWITLLVAGLITTFYTTIGGMKAVVWTDTFQACLMLAGIIAIIIQGTIRVGGFSKVWEINEQWDRIHFITIDFDPRVRHTIFALVIGQGSAWMATSGLSQSSVQRYCSLPTLGQAQASMFINVLIMGAVWALVCYAGITMFAFYAAQDCDLLAQDMVDNTNQLIPYFVMDILAYPLVPGLFMASLFSGALSSMSSALNAMAAILWEDTFKPHFGHKLSEANRTLFIKFIVAILGAICIGASYATIFLDGTVVQAANSLIGPSTGSLAGMFLLGSLCPCANKYGAIAGGITGLAMSSWQAVGSYLSGISNYYKDLPFPDGTCGVNTTLAPMELTTPGLDTTATPMFSTTLASETEETGALVYFYSVSYLYVNLWATIPCIIVGLLVSFITSPLIPKEEREVPTKYLLPFFTRLCCCMPKSWGYYLDCCRNFDTPEDITKATKNSKSEDKPHNQNGRADHVLTEPNDKTRMYYLGGGGGDVVPGAAVVENSTEMRTMQPAYGYSAYS